MNVFHRLIWTVLVVAASVAIVAPSVRAGDRDVGPSAGRGTTVTIVEPSAFDWGDAAVGAAGALGLSVLLAGVVIVARQSFPRRRDANAETSAST
jgi:hypothetical protein